MKLREYLLDKLPYFLLLTVAGVLSYVLLIGTGTSRDAALFAVLLYSLMALIALAVDFVRKFMFYRDMDRWLEQNLYQNAPLNLIDPPGFAEGRAITVSIWCAGCMRSKPGSPRQSSISKTTP